MSQEAGGEEGTYREGGGRGAGCAAGRGLGWE